MISKTRHDVVVSVTQTLDRDQGSRCDAGTNEGGERARVYIYRRAISCAARARLNFASRCVKCPLIKCTFSCGIDFCITFSPAPANSAAARNKMANVYMSF